MTKIALISPYYSQNHGTVLQAFALAAVIKSKNIHCEYIRWIYYDKNLVSKLKFLLKHPSFFYYYKKRNKRMHKNDLDYSFLQREPYLTILKKNKDFCNKYIPVSKRIFTYNQFSGIEKLYDKFIVGSDQTWSPHALYQFSPNYLSFVREKTKKNSYACSFGTTSISPKMQHFYSSQLCKFNNLSCRETANSNWLHSLLDKEVQCVLDPTLLLDVNQWENYFLKVDEVPDNFVLCYILGEKECIQQYAENLGKKMNLPVYYIVTRPCYENKKYALKDVGCQNFLWLIRKCNYLVTDSFHGTIFSINFGKNFVAFDKHQGANLDNGRLYEILKEFNLLSHYHQDDDNSLPEKIDRDNIVALLNEKRKKSLLYLNRILNL